MSRDNDIAPSVMKWLFGIVTVIIGGCATVFFIWTVAASVKQASDIRLLGVRIDALEKRDR